jgi:hypothetical protein
VAAGFLIPVVPFAALAPSRFYEATIIAQIGGRASATRVAIWPRLQFMTGLADLSHPTRIIDTVAVILIVGFVLAGLALGILLTGPRRRRLTCSPSDRPRSLWPCSTGLRGLPSSPATSTATSSALCAPTGRLPIPPHQPKSPR